MSLTILTYERLGFIYIFLLIQTWFYSFSLQLCHGVNIHLLLVQTISAYIKDTVLKIMYTTTFLCNIAVISTVS